MIHQTETGQVMSAIDEAMGRRNALHEAIPNAA